MSEESKMPATQSAEAGTPGAPGQQMPQFAMDSSALSTIYTNFCHVTFTPEELILDFGLNTQTPPSPNQPIKLTHRVVMNFYTAKRLMNGLTSRSAASRACSARWSWTSRSACGRCRRARECARRRDRVRCSR